MQFRKTSIAALLMLALTSLFGSGSANAGAGVIVCQKPVCVLSFRTNAAWVQRARIRSLRHHWRRTFIGRGEGRLHTRFRVRRGRYLVRLSHRYNGRWKGSYVKRGRRCIRANDNGPRGDYNDAIVCVR